MPQVSINATGVDEAIGDDELIVTVPGKSHRSLSFVGVRGHEDWMHIFTGLKVSTAYRIRLELASLTKVV